MTGTDVRLPDLRNLRDVGGPAAGDGRRVRGGVVYRSASPMFLDAAQVGHLVDGLGIRTRVDLRSQVEVSEISNADVASAGWEVAHLPIRSGGAWHEQPREASAAERVSGHYLRYLEHSAGSLTEVVRLVASPGSTPVLVHCSAGKDRTGVVVALLLSAVGVRDEDIVEDYARTREDLGPLLAQLRTLPAYRARLDALPEESLTAEPESMALFLSRMREEYGGGRTYLGRHGIDEDVLTRLEAALLG